MPIELNPKKKIDPTEPVKSDQDIELLGELADHIAREIDPSDKPRKPRPLAPAGAVAEISKEKKIESTSGAK